MMPFTDDDLAKLKFEVAKMDTMQKLTDDSHSMDHMLGLIARLEAAEETIAACIGTSMRYHHFQDAIEAWRKTAGK
jgi:hypothetical protein